MIIENLSSCCAITLQYAKILDKFNSLKLRNQISYDTLRYQVTASPEDIDYLRKEKIPESFPVLTKFDFSPWSIKNEKRPVIVLYMFKELMVMVQ